jgi:hypothetical protein
MPLSAYCFGGIMSTWNVKQTEEFQEWFDKAHKNLKEAIVENVEVLKQLGPQLGRPQADTIKGSTIKNLKELRFISGEKVIRVFYVFDPDRNGVLLIGGNKSSSGDKKFYKDMIDKSEKIYAKYLEERKQALDKEKQKVEKKKEPSKNKKKGKKK